MRNTAFSRAISMIGMIAAAMACSNPLDRQAAMANIGPYESHGKGGKTPRRPTGIAKIRRAARAARARK